MQIERRNTLRFLVICIIACSIFSGCNVYQYIPNSLNVPLLEHKHQLKGSFGIHNQQIAYSFSDHFAITGNYFWKKQSYDSRIFIIGEKHGSSNEKNKNNISDFEIALGYFASHNNFHFEIHSGGGFGKVSYYHCLWQTTYKYKYKVNPIKTYLQINFGVVPKNGLIIALSTKLLQYYHYNLDYSYNDMNTNKINEAGDLDFEKQSNKILYFIQPALIMRTNNNERVNFGLQASFNRCLNHVKYNYEDMFIRFNVLLKFDLRRKNKRT